MKSWTELYNRYYRKLLWLPMLLLLLALVQMGVQYATTGDFVHRGITLKGGSTLTLENTPELTRQEAEGFLTVRFPQHEINVRTLSSAGQVVGLAIDSDAQVQGEIDALLTALGEKVDFNTTQYSVEIIGAALGQSFFRQTLTALLLAFGLMGVVVLLYFRTIVPSLAVILAAFSDITVTLSIFNLTGSRLSSAGIAAFLMLIGYSVDTDILLTSRVLKRQEGTVEERIYGAMKTGLTMTATTLAAIVAAFIFVQSDVVHQIMLVLGIGLLVDVLMTWIQNAAILRWYVRRKQP